MAEASFDALPFDDVCARTYGSVFAAVADAGRKPRGRRMVDLLIAATAIAHDLPLYTCNPRDFDGLASLLEVIQRSSSRPRRHAATAIAQVAANMPTTT